MEIIELDLTGCTHQIDIQKRMDLFNPCARL